MASSTEEMRHGSCLCRKVTYSISGPPLMNTLCHCLNCQKASGSLFQANAGYKKDQFQILSGQDSIQTYLDSDTDSGSVLHRRFCGNCGSTLFVTNETKVAARDMIIVMTGCMDGAKDFVFEREFFYKDRHQSMPKMEGTEKHETMPDWLK